MTTTTLTVATANLGRGVGTPEFVANVRRLKDRIPNPAVIGFQEIDEADTPNEHAVLRDVFPGRTWAGWATDEGVPVRCPIGVPHLWEIVPGTARVSSGSGGVAHLTPPRKVVEAVIHPDGQPDLTVAVLNWHSPRNDHRLDDERRDTIAKVVERLDALKVDGRDVLATTDANDLALLQHWPGLRATGVRILAHAGLDYVLHLPAPANGLAVEKVKQGSVDLTIDGHNAHWATVRLTKAA